MGEGLKRVRPKSRHRSRGGQRRRARSALVGILTAFFCMVGSGGGSPAPPPASPPETISADDLINSVDQWMRENLDDNILQALEEVDRDKVRLILNELLKRLQNSSVYDLGSLKE